MSFARCRSIRPATSPPGVDVSLFYFDPTNASEDDSETINYTGALISPPTGYTIFKSNQTITAANAGSQPAGPQNRGFVAAVTGRSAYGADDRAPRASIAAGNWTLSLTFGGTGLLGPTVNLGIKVWQVSADLSTATVIRDWDYRPELVGRTGAATITASAFNPGAVTMNSATPYLYFEFMLRVTSGGSNIIANPITISGVAVDLPAVSYARGPTDGIAVREVLEDSGRYPIGQLVGAGFSLVDSPFGAAFGKALSFSGGAYLDCGSSGVAVPSGSFTLEAKVRYSSLANQPIAQLGSDGQKISLQGLLSTFRIFYYTGAADGFIDTTGITPAINTNYDFALSWDGTTMRVFINGVLRASAVGIPVAAPPAARKMLIAGGSAAFNGTIDQVRLSRIARYTSGYTPAASPFTPDADTLGLWHLDALRADSVQRVFSGARSANESVAAANDVPTRILNAARNPVETIPAASATSTRFTQVFRIPTETIPAANDAPARQFSGARTISEMVAAAMDSVARIFNANRTPTENIPSASDAVTRIANFNRTASESVTTATDSVARFFEGIRVVAETITTASDSISRIANFNRTQVETISEGGAAPVYRRKKLIVDD